MRKKSILLFSIIFMTFLALPVQGQETLSELRHPVAQVLDLLVNGTTPVLINLTADFEWITGVVWNLDFVSNQIIFTNFAGGSALSIGIQVLHDGVSILGDGEISRNHEFGHTSFDVKILSDEAGTKNRLLLARWILSRVVPPDGVRFISNESFQILISDDLTDPNLAITDFTITVGGFRIEKVRQGTSTQTEFFLIDAFNWWAFFLYQNIFVLLGAAASLIVLIKIFRN